jgi:DNA repair exonuclease SbcCD nuclease subunit
MREHLGYSDYIKDARKQEKKDVLDIIIKTSNLCDGVVFLGDQFHLKNNTSEVIREFVEFIEKIGQKEIYIIAGNHEKYGTGKSAIDFLKEVNKKNWHVITNKTEAIDDMVFCPYFYKGELGTRSLKEASDTIAKKLISYKKKILFCHHAISDMKLNDISTNTFNEIVLNKKKLEDNFNLVFAGHIHEPSMHGKVVFSGSVFTNEIGERNRYIYTIDTDADNFGMKRINLPVRQIIKIENPTDKDIDSIPKGSIVKIVLTKKVERNDINLLKEKLKIHTDAYLIVEKFSNTREKIKEGSIIGMSIEELLKVYAKEKKINEQELFIGFNLIK